MQVNISARMRQDFLSMIQSEENKQVTRLGKEIKLFKIAEDEEAAKEEPLADDPAPDNSPPTAGYAHQDAPIRGSLIGLGKTVGRVVSSGVRHSVASLGSRMSRGDKNSAMLRQLGTLDRELVALIEKDSFPRWKKKADEVDRFLLNEPCDALRV